MKTHSKGEKEILMYHKDVSAATREPRAIFNDKNNLQKQAPTKGSTTKMSVHVYVTWWISHLTEAFISISKKTPQNYILLYLPTNFRKTRKMPIKTNGSGNPIYQHFNYSFTKAANTKNTWIKKGQQESFHRRDCFS